MRETPYIPAGQIGRSIPRIEARAKVTGTAEYIHNLRLPGMLWAKICRSTMPHGRIRHIDTSAAAAEAPVVADHHGSAAYKRVLIEVHLQRALRRALDGAPR